MNTRKILIIQTLGVIKSYIRRKYIIGGDLESEYHCMLSSAAVYRYLESMGERPELVFLLPLSLFKLSRAEMENRLFHPEDRYSHEICREYIFNENRELYKEIEDLNYSIYMIPALGSVKRDKTDRYIADPDTIETYIFLVIRRKLSNNISKIYYDISTGWNQYNLIVSDAMRSLIVYSKLKSLFKESIDVYEIQSEPVTRDIDRARIYLRNIDVRAFLSLPYRENRLRDLSQLTKLNNYIEGWNSDDKKNIGMDGWEVGFNRKVDKLLSSLIQLYRGVTLNTPLAIVDPDLINIEEVDPDEVENLLYEIIIKYMCDVKFEDRADERIYKWRRFKFGEIRNMYLSAALYDGLRNRIRCIRDKVLNNDGWINLDKLYKEFEKLYKDLNLEVNISFLRREVYDIKARVDDWKKQYTTKEFTLDLLHKYIPEISERRVSNEKRNFFAHSGLLREIVKIRILEDSIFVKYDEDKKYENILKWLTHPG